MQIVNLTKSSVSITVLLCIYMCTCTCIGRGRGRVREGQREERERERVRQGRGGDYYFTLVVNLSPCNEYMWMPTGKGLSLLHSCT